MIFFSHSRAHPSGDSCGSKHLVDHVNGVFNKVITHYAPNVELGISKNELTNLLETVVRLHDFGKYTSYFQNYLLNKKPIDLQLKQHARIGAFIAYNLLKDKDEKLALIAFFLIFLHHTKLSSHRYFTQKLDDHLRWVIERQIVDLIPNVSLIENELGIDLSIAIYYPDEKSIRRGLKHMAVKEKNIQNYFLINYSFSLLIEADKLDASDTIPYLPMKIDSASVEKRIRRLFPNQSHNSHNMSSRPLALENLGNNRLRDLCRYQVIANLNSPGILDHYIFTLTAPTGIGKTLTALDFALKLREKISPSLSQEARIIYALPFINIIEQAFKEYKDTLPKNVKILAHYQYADIFGQDTETGNEDGSETNYNKKLMALDTWQADVIITSFVQFLETLISNKNRLLKKFNHYANSIIILDEVQTMRMDQMPLIGASLYYLSKFLKARIILMTATKPKIFELAQDQLLSNEGERVSPLELLACHEEVFAIFHRTKIVSLLNRTYDQENLASDFIQKDFSKKWHHNKSCIIVCNTVNRSIEIYNAVKEHLAKMNYQNPVEYLSTNIIPVHRFERIQLLSHYITKRMAPILIATQVVEAGVDLDFDMGFRDIGPIDSLVQVAGRINRHNDPQKKDSPLYIVDFSDAQKIYGKITYDQARLALTPQKEVFEADYLKLVNLYFDNISDRKSFTRFNKIFESMKMLRYTSEAEEEERPVSSFKVIEESRISQAVFIELSEEEKILREKYLQKITQHITKANFDKNYKLAFQQRIITVPDYLTQGLPYINQFDDTLKVVDHNIMPQTYNSQTGFIRSVTSPENELHIL